MNNLDWIMKKELTQRTVLYVGCQDISQESISVIPRQSDTTLKIKYNQIFVYFF